MLEINYENRVVETLVMYDHSGSRNMATTNVTVCAMKFELRYKRSKLGIKLIFGGV